MLESEAILDTCDVIKSDRECKLTQRRGQSNEGGQLHTGVLDRGDLQHGRKPGLQ